MRWPVGAVSTVTGASSPDLAAKAALGFSVLVPAIELWRIGVFGETRAFVFAALATLLYLPLHLRHVSYGLQGRRPAAAVPTLALMAAVVVGAWALVGQQWLFMFASLTVSVLCTLPIRVAAVAAALVVLSPLVYGWLLPLSGTAPYSGQFLSLAVLFRSTCLFVVVWLVATSRRLGELRGVLADAAVRDEQVQLRADLHQQLGSRLARIAELAELADQRAAGRSPDTALAVKELIGASRSTLYEVKQLVDAYQRVSARTELHAAAALLSGAGIDADMVRDARDRGSFVLPDQVGETRR